jgi:hypothetical protein
VVVLTGARRSCKKSTLRRLFPDHEFVSLDLPTEDAVNLDFVRNVVGKSRIAGGAIVCRTANSYALTDGVRALSVVDLA